MLFTLTVNNLPAWSVPLNTDDDDDRGGNHLLNLCLSRFDACDVISAKVVAMMKLVWKTGIVKERAYHGINDIVASDHLSYAP